MIEETPMTAAQNDNDDGDSDISVKGGTHKVDSGYSYIGSEGIFTFDADGRTVEE